MLEGYSSQDHALPSLRFEPTGCELEVDAHTTLFSAAKALGLPVGSACDAEGICGRCGLRPLGGAEHLSEETDAERRVKRDNEVDPALRLSCVATVRRGRVVLTADYW